MKSILNYIGKIDEDCEAFIRLDGILFEGNNNILTLIVKNMCDNKNADKWEIIVKSLLDYKIEMPYGNIQFYENDHVLIKLRNEENVSLYFRGKSENVESLVGLLYQVHNTVCHWMVPFEAYLNRPDTLFRLLGEGYGLLGRGPISVITEYAKVLEAENIGVSIVACNSNNVKSVDENLSILTLGKSYFIGCDFHSRYIGTVNL